MSTTTFPGPILFGAGAVGELGQHARRFGAVRVFLVTGPRVAEEGLTQRGVISLQSAGLEVVQFHDGRLNPTDVDIRMGVDRYREEECGVIVALGGGSRIDLAKGIRLLASHAGDVEQYYFDNGGAQRISANMPPLICIPTTAGSGSEISRGAVITDLTQNRKRLITAPAMMSSLCILDPELTVSMSPHLTAVSGLDALSHAIETYVGIAFNPIAKAVSRQAAAIIWRYLPRAVFDGADLEARAQMLFASAMVAISFVKGLGVVHSLAHQLSPEADLAHGLAVALMLPHGMEFNRPRATADYADLARATGAALPESSDELCCENIIDQVSEMAETFALPRSLGEAGVAKERLPRMAKKAMLDHCHRTNPRACTEADMLSLFERAF